MLASLSVSTVLVPQAVAYAFLAGMPPIYGLYASLSALIIYPILGTSRFLAVGPVALLSIIVMSGVSQLAEPYSDRFIELVLLCTFLSGLIQIALGILKIGSLAKFLSDPVLKGFVMGAAITIAISQLPVLLQLDVEKGDSAIHSLYHLIPSIKDMSLLSTLLGITGIAVLLILKRVNKMIPSYLILVVIGILITYLLRLDTKGVRILGELPSGLPSFSYSFLSVHDILNLLPTAVVIALICFISSYSISKAFEDKQDGAIQPNKELLSLGLLKVVGSFFLGMPSSASFSRSAVYASTSPKTQIAYYITAIIIALALLFLGYYFYYLPLPILAAIIIASVLGLINFSYPKMVARYDKKEFILFLSTLLITLTLGLVPGILIGVGISLLWVISNLSNPHYAILGKLPGTKSYRNLERYPSALVENDTLIIRYDQDLFFGNADDFLDKMILEINKKPALKKVVLHIGSIHNIDSTAMSRIEKLISYCEEHDLSIHFTNMSGPIRDVFAKRGLFQKLGNHSFHLSVAAAMDSDIQNTNFATQTNTTAS